MASSEKKNASLGGNFTIFCLSIIQSIDELHTRKEEIAGTTNQPNNKHKTLIAATINLLLINY